MNTTRVLAVAALMLAGITAARATDVVPAWRSDGFVMEEIVVTAEAPASYYMEEIVVMAQAPDHLYMEEIVVIATAPREALPMRLAERFQNRRAARHF